MRSSPEFLVLSHCQLFLLTISGHQLFNQLAIMAHDVIEGVFEGEEEPRLCVKLLCIPTLSDEIDMLQPNGPQSHIDTPFAGHGLQGEVSHIIFERQTVLRAELNQRIRGLAMALLVGDWN